MVLMGVEEQSPTPVMLPPTDRRTEFGCGVPGVAGAVSHASIEVR
jgi:hypothetical protein